MAQGSGFFWDTVYICNWIKDMYISIIRFKDMYISVIQVADIINRIEDWIEDIFNLIMDMHISVIEWLNSKRACHRNAFISAPSCFCHSAQNRAVAVGIRPFGSGENRLFKMISIFCSKISNWLSINTNWFAKLSHILDYNEAIFVFTRQMNTKDQNHRPTDCPNWATLLNYCYAICSVSLSNINVK